MYIIKLEKNKIYASIVLYLLLLLILLMFLFVEGRNRFFLYISILHEVTVMSQLLLRYIFVNPTNNKNKNRYSFIGKVTTL